MNITTQPGQGSHGVQVYESPEGVTVRTMRADDADFAGRVMVEGFRDKFSHALGTQRLDLAQRASADDHTINPSKYHRIFVAEYNGERAGAMELKFHGDGSGETSRLWDSFGCRQSIRLACFGFLVDEKSPRSTCYLDHISVDERFRGRGVGKALMLVADQQARARQCHTIFLWVASDNRAKNLYTRQGYRVTDSSSCSCMMHWISGKRKFEKMEKPL